MHFPSFMPRQNVAILFRQKLTLKFLTNNASSSTVLRGESFRIVEVGARDGLQNEQEIVPTERKVKLINRLSECGFKTIEATSFVSPKWVPQMADHDDVINQCKKYPGISYPVLVPNLAGLSKAMKNGNIHEIAVFTAVSDAFCRKNLNCSLEEGEQRLREVAEEAVKNGLKVRGYISTVIGCPYEGPIRPMPVAKMAERLLAYGCYEVSLGDTIGVGNAATVAALLDEVLKGVPAAHVAVHFHDTYGQALSNVLVSIEKGIRVADSSVAGLGGCPFAKGATGNLATEDLVYLLNGIGFHTGIDLDKLVNTSEWICEKMGRQNQSRTAKAMLSKKKRPT